MTDDNRPDRRRWLAALVPLLLVLGLLYTAYGRGSVQHAGTIEGPTLDGAVVALRGERQAPVAPGEGLILFGDLHVHTTFSADAFMRSMPLMAGEGMHPPADACDFARYCSDLDFFALTDHAEALTPRMWRESVASLRACAARSGEPSAPDLVPYMGFEWSHVGLTPETHYGHKNVIFPSLDDAKLPARPIGAGGAARRTMNAAGAGLVVQRATIPLLDLGNSAAYMDLVTYIREVQAVDLCPDGVPSPELPATCRELASTPAELFAKLNAWDLDALVIPHGSTWGFYTPPGYLWDKQLDPAMDDPARQRLVEVHSGHGNSEEYRPWRHVIDNGDGTYGCPEPSEGFEPCCWRAGELIRARCGVEEPAEACEARVKQARLDYANSGAAGHNAVPGARVEEWGNCGQCTDCALPAFNSRPGGAVQYMLARGHFAAGQPPRHQTMGFIASSDNHTARPGTGYKEFERRKMTEATGPISDFWRDRALQAPPERARTSTRVTEEQASTMNGFQLVDLERQASFFQTGGLVAVHAAQRSREAIFTALRDRQVYGTSGPRILLWFDLLNAPGGVTPMGREVTLNAPPTFRVRAAGAFVQKPGCPDHVTNALGAERLERLCVGECYNPGDARHKVTRIEVVRIRRQMNPDEAVKDLIDDPWRTLPCPADRDVCEVEFTGAPPEPGRQALYYVRAIQEPTDAVNGDALRCDESGQCDPCFGDHRTNFSDDCLAPVEERAWSSPIFIRP